MHTQGGHILFSNKILKESNQHGFTCIGLTAENHECLQAIIQGEAIRHVFKQHLDVLFGQLGFLEEIIQPGLSEWLILTNRVRNL